MGDVIDLQQNQLTQLKDNIEFVSDCCRFRENILSEAAVKKKWKFDAATWEKLGDDDELVRAIEAARTHWREVDGRPLIFDAEPVE